MPTASMAAAFLLLAGIAIYAVILYNGLIRLQSEIARAWANIDVLLKQRHDEIPNLVACVAGYIDHERRTLDAVSAARNASTNASGVSAKAQTEASLNTTLRSLYAVAERYPRLKADRNFRELQSRITALEERIADRREFFNDDVNTFNTRIRQFPDTLLARIMRLQPQPMFRVSRQELQPEKAKFAVAR